MRIEWVTLRIALFCLLAFGRATADEIFDPTYREIVSADNARKFLGKSSCAGLPDGLTRKISDTWTPGTEDVDFLEVILPSALTKSIGETDWIGPKSRETLMERKSIINHARQYVGITIGGRKMILLVAAPRYVIDFDGRQDMAEFADIRWREHPIGACDGGPAQFNVLYDPKEKRFQEFLFSCTFAGCSVP